jgi:hypothetical protein
MKSNSLLRLGAAFAIAAGGALVSAQQTTLLPSAPAKQFGGTIAPVYEGWWDNADGTKTVLFGYYSRNTVEEVDVPLGPNNHFEPGDQDRGQPTHFLTSRQYGMFTLTLPKDFGKQQKLTWVLNTVGYNGTANVNLSPDFVMSASKSVEESPDRTFNLPPVFSFEPAGLKFTHPMASTTNIVKRTATVGTPMPLDIYTEDDARFSSGTNAPMRNPPPVVTLVVSKYRGPGQVTIAERRPKVEAAKGGKPFEPFAGKATTTVSFSEPGEYWLHVTANDYSGHGGAGAGCCWTTGVMKVSVSGSVTPRTTGQ